MFKHDRTIQISTGASRKATNWVGQKLAWSDFVERISKPIRTTESFAEYKSLTKAKQDEIKDVGGFVGGTLRDGRRKNEFAGVRDLVTLDADAVAPGATNKVLAAVAGMGCAYAVYSTRKHEGAAPRLRIVVPLDRSCSADEYEPIARKLAEFVGIGAFDPTTFEPVRLMYWPSCSSDSEYVFAYEDKPFASADGILGMYRDWTDVSEWPEVPGAAKIRERSARKQGDPLEKRGVVGAFCRRYSIEEAMGEFIPGEYSPCRDDRYTYAGGSTVGGAVLYDGKFIYSHHATDPCSGRLCNAFDMVRLHLFGEEDAEALPETPVTNLPSYKRMCEFAVSLPDVSQALLRERYLQAAQEFSGQPLGANQIPEDYGWMSKLDLNAQTGKPLNTIINVQLVLENDAKLRGRMYLDDFSNKIVVEGPLPWEVPEYPWRERTWTDADDSGLRSYLEKTYTLTGKERIMDGFAVYANNHRRNKLKEYLQAVRWDGVPRLDGLLIDYFGAEDNAYSRESIRKCLVAAVTRVFNPGVKFDVMLILYGSQGTGKSTFFNTLGGQWYSDSLSTFEGKEAAELLQGYWIIEAGELTGMNRSEMNAVKQFMSKREDVYRVPYGRRTETFPRRCVIVGTTNDKEFLKDVTGNRRFWPIDTETVAPTKNVFRDLPRERDQIWAEAVFLAGNGESLVLSAAAEAYAVESQTNHREANPKEGAVLEFLDVPITPDWYQKSANARRDIMIGGLTEGSTVRRDRICAAELYIECFKNMGLGAMKRQDTKEINDILRALPGWEPIRYPVTFGAGYGNQRGYRRVT